MNTVIEAIYENGVLKPLTAHNLKEGQRYRLIITEATPLDWPDSVRNDPELLAEVERRTTILPDGRIAIRIVGVLEKHLGDLREDADPIADVLREMREERARHFDEEWPELPASSS